MTDQEKDDDTLLKIREAADAGLILLHSTINNTAEKANVRLDAAKWAIEKSRQRDPTESVSLSTFMEILKDLKLKGELVEISSSTSDNSLHNESQNRFGSWLEKNL